MGTTARPHDRTITSERALICVGRRLNAAGLGLENLPLETGSRGEIPVDVHFATAVSGIYAIGDVTGHAQLAHLATHQGIVAVQHALGDQSARLDAGAVPWVVFTRPNLACVGLSEVQARTQGTEVGTGTCLLRQLGKAHVTNELDGLVKLIVDRASGTLLGAHLIGAGAEDLIGELTLAVRHRLTARQIFHTIHPHPTMSEGIWTAARAALE